MDFMVRLMTMESIKQQLKELFEKNPPKIYMILTHLASRLRTMSRMYIDACADMVKL